MRVLVVEDEVLIRLAAADHLRSCGFKVAEAGNAAMRSVSTAGLFVGGGIAPKILPALSDGRFLRAFREKGAMRPMLERMPVHVILNQDAGLLGAAVFANQRLARPH